MLTFASTFLLLIWIGLYVFSSQTRREQIIMSIVGLILTPGAFVLILSNTNGNASIELSATVEPFLFAICLFGIAAVGYQATLSPYLTEKKPSKARKPLSLGHWLGHLLIILSVWILIGIFGYLILREPPIQAMALGGVLVGTYIIADRKDLLWNSLTSGLLIATLVFGVEQWLGAILLPATALAGRTGIILGGIPIEELVWAAVVGFAVGPLYEYIRHERLILRTRYARP
ncbi:hypothetical protein HYV73_00405 [Candidatus Uhrbacteria bacterium]|nr:hypothetical protein [Candidatus Uhrbacteria bacterium]